MFRKLDSLLFSCSRSTYFASLWLIVQRCDLEKIEVGGFVQMVAVTFSTQRHCQRCMKVRTMGKLRWFHVFCDADLLKFCGDTCAIADEVCRYRNPSLLLSELNYEYRRETEGVLLQNLSLLPSSSEQALHFNSDMYVTTKETSCQISGRGISTKRPFFPKL